MREIEFNDLVRLKASDSATVLLDCRAAEYWLWETISGSTNLRWKEVEQRASRVVPDKTAQIVTFCQSPLCDASHKAYSALEEMGYSNLYEYFGGVEDWRTRGGEISRSPCRISEHAFKFPSQKFYGSPANSYLIDCQDAVVLVDGPQSLTDSNEDFILSFNKPIWFFMTHGATAGMSEILKGTHQAKIFMHSADLSSEWLTCNPTDQFESDFNLTPNLSVLCTPGYTPGSASLFDKRSGLLFSGGTVQGSSENEVWDFVTSPEDNGDVMQQLRSLEKLTKLEITGIHPFQRESIIQNPNQALEQFRAKYQNFNGEK